MSPNLKYLPRRAVAQAEPVDLVEHDPELAGDELAVITHLFGWSEGDLLPCDTIGSEGVGCRYLLLQY